MAKCLVPCKEAPHKWTDRVMQQLRETASTSDYHGKGGPLPVSTTTAGNPNEMSRLFVKAAVANGTLGE